MFNYNVYSNQIKVFFVDFSLKISSGLKKPEIKFVTDMIFGITKSNSVMLSDIARALNESIKLKDTIDRLSQNLEKLYDKRNALWQNHYDNIAKDVNDDSLFIIDNSDIVKPFGTHFEDLDLVKDGSDPNGKIENGYYQTEIAMLSKGALNPVSVYSHIFSTLTKGFKSLNEETFKALNQIYQRFGNVGTCVMDRGYDSKRIFGYFIKKSWGFVIRGKDNRNVIYQGKTINIKELSDLFKGKINIKLLIKGKTLNRKCSYVKVKIPGVSKQLTIVFVYFKKDVAIFYTNKEIMCKKDCIKVVNSYYKRWRVEEYFKYTKNQFDLENIRVRSLKRINMLNLLLSMSICGINRITINNSKMLMVIKQSAKSIKETVYFEYYRLTDGIYELLCKTYQGIRNLLPNYKETKRQLSLFPINSIPI